MYLFHGIIRPTRKGVTTISDETGKSKKVTKKFGIKDSIESMIRTRTNISATSIKKKIDQPHILCIGEDVFHLREFYAVMEDTTYKATSFLHALEITFKMFNLFDFSYPLESINVWLFIQKVFFDIHYEKHDFINSDVHSLMEKFNIFSQKQSVND